MGFNHFFRARAAQQEAGGGGADGDLVFFQPHSAPGVYARAYLEGRLTEADLAHYRQELTAPAAGARGLSSYPHPWLMPDFWQFPTGSMGLGPISSIYHARFMRYLTHRQLLDCGAREENGTLIDGRPVWGVFGDGEMDEPESMSALTLASREKLDNLVSGGQQAAGNSPPSQAIDLAASGLASPAERPKMAFENLIRRAAS